MKKIIFILIIILLLSFNSNSQEDKMNQESEYGILFSIDKGVYQAGETITMKIMVFNFSAETIYFHFNSSQRYDFLIEDMEGKLIWQWSEDKMFAMVLGEEKLNVNHPELIYQESYDKEIEPGHYRIKGVFTAKNYPMSAEMVFQVK